MTKAPTLSIVVAAAQNGAIGKDGKMPWHISSDLKRFRALTMGKVVLMGRNTFESIGKPLDGRENVVVTANLRLAEKGVWTVASIKEAFDFSNRLSEELQVDEIMIIGGAQIYASTINMVDKVYLTRVMASPEGDTFFPELDQGEWKMVSQEDCPKGFRDDFAHCFEIYERRS